MLEGTGVDSRPTPRTEPLTLVALTVLALALLLPGLRQSLWYDELWSATQPSWQRIS